MRLKWKGLLTASVVGLLATTATIGWSSSHREAPRTAGMPRIDSTDFYMFRSYEAGRDKFVTLIANYVPLQAPYGGPNYFMLDNDAVYDIHIDNNGDAVEDLTYRFNFDSKRPAIALKVGGKNVAIPLRQAGQITAPNAATLNDQERYTLSLIKGPRSGTSQPITSTQGGAMFLKPVDNIGNKTLPNYSAYAKQHINPIRIPGCAVAGRAFVGQRAEAFAVNLGEIFDLVNIVPIEGDSAPGAGDGKGFPGGITQDRRNDDVVGESNVTSLALEVPIACLTGNGNGVIGAWTTSSLPQRLAGTGNPATPNALVQVSRLSAPLVNELVIGLKDKDLYSGAQPKQDGALATYVTNPTLPALLDLLFRDAVNTTLGTNIPNLAPTNFPRKDLVAAFLTGFSGLNQLKTVTPSEMMRLNTAVPPKPRGMQSTFGVAAGDLAGFPNGRRPGDDAVDLALRVVMGRLCYPLPIGKALGGTENNVNLGLCRPRDAAVGNVPFTDGAPISAMELKNVFPYLNDPIPGSPNDPGASG